MIKRTTWVVKQQLRNLLTPSVTIMTGENKGRKGWYKGYVVDNENVLLMIIELSGVYNYAHVLEKPVDVSFNNGYVDHKSYEKPF